MDITVICSVDNAHFCCEKKIGIATSLKTTYFNGINSMKTIGQQAPHFVLHQGRSVRDDVGASASVIRSQLSNFSIKAAQKKYQSTGMFTRTRRAVIRDPSRHHTRTFCANPVGLPKMYTMVTLKIPKAGNAKPLPHNKSEK